jgi:YD repeat-containing protein
VLVTQRIGSDNSAITQRQYQYDTLGRVTAETNALNGVTTQAYGFVNHGVSVTNTYPDGGTRLELDNSDGTVQSVTGTAVHPVQYIYGVDTGADGVNDRAFTINVNLTATGGTNEWTKTYTDSFGHAFETIYASRQ